MNNAEGQPTGTSIPGIKGFLAALREDWHSLWGRREDRLAAKVLIASVILLVIYAMWGLKSSADRGVGKVWARRLGR
ncbi:MAG: hypothetical protein ACR2QM_05210 [Longimicrobiales bacterium]